MALGDIMGGEVGVLDRSIEASGRFIGPGNEEERRGMPWSPSGDIRNEVFVGACEWLETRLTREELLLMAVGGEMVSGTEVTTCCLG